MLARTCLRSFGVAFTFALALGGSSGAGSSAAATSVTVYTRDLGFVRETRGFDLRAARDTVRLTDVPKRLDFTSLRFVPAGGAKLARLAWRYDLESGEGLIERAIGLPVRVTSRGERMTEGTLLAADGGWLVLRAEDGSLHSVSRGAIETLWLSNAPNDITLRPTLEAALEAPRRGRVEAELSYLTGGLSWSAEHVVVRRGERAASWGTGVTIQNETGRDFVDARLKLVAGEPRREAPPPMPMKAGRFQELAMAAEAPGDVLTEQAFAEYHLYTLDRPATLRDRESQRLTMLESRAIRVEPRYFYRGGARGVLTQMVARNDDASGLGVPLPGGRVRFYEADPAGDLQFTGETSIPHTAKGEKLTLDVGEAFDLVAERRDLFQRRISDREREYGVEIKLRNRKKTEVAIVVEEGVGGDSEVIEKTHEFARKDANTIEFRVPVAAGKEAVLRYTARVRF